MFYIKDLFVPLHHPSLQGHINFYYCRFIYLYITVYRVYKDILISTIVDQDGEDYAEAWGLQGHINFYDCRL